MTNFSEQIKNFDKIRDYMRDFFVYGLKSREQFTKKSARSYDNEKRRIESYLSEYMSFNRTQDGKSVFISVDSRMIANNPFYKAYKAKTFTKKDITLHFLILDILAEREEISVFEIADLISDNYLRMFDNPMDFDISTVRNKLTEYVKMGLINASRSGKKITYSLSADNIPLEELSDAIMFFSEVCPLGLPGSYLLDRLQYKNKHFSFKHHYIVHVLESEILAELLEAIERKKKVEITVHAPNEDGESALQVIPLKILISVQSGRRYLAAHDIEYQRIMSFRLDYIKSVKHLEFSSDFDFHMERFLDLNKLVWGVSFGDDTATDHLEMSLFIGKDEQHIVSRIKREGRHGSLKQIDDTTYVYTIAVLDAMEMMPWLRTFIGRIISLKCTNVKVTSTFYNDLAALYELYGGDD